MSKYRNHLSNQAYRDKVDAEFFSIDSPQASESGEISATPFRKVENNEDVHLSYQPNRIQFSASSYLSLDGIDQHVIVENSSGIHSTDYLQIVLWFRGTDNGDAGQTLVSKFDFTGNQREWLLYYTTASGRLELVLSADGTSSTNIATLLVGTENCFDGEWHYLSIKVNRTVVPFRITYNYDGFISVRTAGISTIFQSNAPIVIGAMDSSNADVRHATVDIAGLYISHALYLMGSEGQEVISLKSNGSNLLRRNHENISPQVYIPFNDFTSFNQIADVAEISTGLNFNNIASNDFITNGFNVDNKYSHLNENGYNKFDYNRFNGSSRYAVVPNSSSFTTSRFIQIAFWFRAINGIPLQNEYLVSKYTTSTNQRSWLIEYDQILGHLQFIVCTNGEVSGITQIDLPEITGASLYDGEWHFLSIRFDGESNDGNTTTITYNYDDFIRQVFDPFAKLPFLSTAPIAIGVLSADETPIIRCSFDLVGLYISTELHTYGTPNGPADISFPANRLLRGSYHESINPFFYLPIDKSLSTSVGEISYIGFTPSNDDFEIFPASVVNSNEDIIGNGLNLTTNNKLLPRLQLVSKAVSLNGTNQAWTPGNISAANDFNVLSYSCRFKFNNGASSTAGHIIMGRSKNASGNRHSINAKTNNRWAMIAGSDSTVIEIPDITVSDYIDGEWHYLEHRIDLSTNTQYFTLDDFTHSGSADITSSPNDFTFGASNGADGLITSALFYSDISICDVKVWNNSTNEVYYQAPCYEGGGRAITDVSNNTGIPKLITGTDDVTWVDQEVHHYKFFNDHDNLEPETINLYKLANDVVDNDVYIFDRFLKRLKERFNLEKGIDSLKTIFGSLYITSAPTSTNNIHLDDVIEPITFHRIVATTGTLAVAPDVGIGLDNNTHRASTDRSVNELINDNNAGLTSTNIEMFCMVNVAQGLTTDGDAAGLIGPGGSQSARILLRNQSGQLNCFSSFMTDNFGSTDGDISNEVGMYYVKRNGTTTRLYKDGVLLGSYTRTTVVNGGNFSIANNTGSNNQAFSGRIGLWGFANPKSTFDAMILKEEYEAFLTELQANTVVTNDIEIAKTGYNKNKKYNFTTKVRFSDIPQVNKSIRGETQTPQEILVTSENKTIQEDKLLITSKSLTNVQSNRNKFNKKYLDEYLVAGEKAWCYSLYRRFKDYIGPALQLRRLSDNATRDVFFTEDIINWYDDDLLTWVSEAEVEVAKMYDQVPLSFQLFNSTTGFTAPAIGEGPTIYENDQWVNLTGTDIVAMHFNGTDEELMTSNEAQGRKYMYHLGVGEYLSGNTYFTNIFHGLAGGSAWNLLRILGTDTQAYFRDSGQDYAVNISGEGGASNPMIVGYRSTINSINSSKNGKIQSKAIFAVPLPPGNNSSTLIAGNLRDDGLFSEMRMTESIGIFDPLEGRYFEIEKILNQTYNFE